MEKLSNDVSRKTLKRTIQEVINNVETVITSIYDILGEMGALVQQIDQTTEKLENQLSERLNRREVLKDAEQKQSVASNRLNTPCDSKQMFPSPFMDYTYLDLMNNCEACTLEVGKFAYNDKYPLWIQFDTWHTGNTPSDVSYVSTESDVTKSARESNNNSWKSAAHLEESLKTNAEKKLEASKQYGDTLSRLGNCCNGVNKLNGSYCGIYEQIMEELLESEFQSCDTSPRDDSDMRSDSGEICSKYSLSLSDEHIVHYNKTLDTWTAFKPENAFSDYSCSTCS